MNNSISIKVHIILYIAENLQLSGKYWGRTESYKPTSCKNRRKNMHTVEILYRCILATSSPIFTINEIPDIFSHYILVSNHTLKHSLSPACGAYISQLICHARAWSVFSQF